MLFKLKSFVVFFKLFVLQEIAGMFSTVGMCEQAVAAFTKVHTINKSFSLATVIRAVPSAFF